MRLFAMLVSMAEVGDPRDAFDKYDMPEVGLWGRMFRPRLSAIPIMFW